LTTSQDFILFSQTPFLDQKADLFSQKLQPYPLKLAPGR